MAAPPCPADAFRYNATLCACNPGRYFNATGAAAAACVPFAAPGGDWVVSSGVSPAPTLLSTVLPLDSIQRLTRSQSVLLWTTLATLLAWLAFCAAVRFGRVGGGRSIWFRIRWWISRLDSFDARHWLDDGKTVVKRKTELGGTFSVASWILFVGLLSALLYQIISTRSVKVQRVRPTNYMDLRSYSNDMEFNITTVSSMGCSHLRGLDKFVIGSPGSIDFKIFPLSTYVNYSCSNTSKGPTISLTCNPCRVPRENYYISWQFIDLPNEPATAVGFEFNLTAKDHGDKKQVSFISGTLISGSSMEDGPKTFRGLDLNILKIHLFPQKFIYLQDLKLIQPLVHDFIPGSSFSEASSLESSLRSTRDGLINITLHISYLSDYIVEIDKENAVGLVTFFADVGGLYVVTLGIFLYLLLQCEARIKKLRNEDHFMRDIRSRRRAQRHWDKLRKYVMFTWGHSNLDIKISSKQHECLMLNSSCGIGSLHKLKQPSGSDSINLKRLTSIRNETNIVSVPENNPTPENIPTGGVKSRTTDCSTKLCGTFPILEAEHSSLSISGSEISIP